MRSEQSLEAAFFRQMLGRGIPRTITITKDAAPLQFIGRESSDDLFVFSCSLTLSPWAMRTAGYEACIEILETGAILPRLKSSAGRLRKFYRPCAGRVWRQGPGLPRAARCASRDVERTAVRISGRGSCIVAPQQHTDRAEDHRSTGRCSLLPAPRLK
jgi:hypothetical protein